MKENFISILGHSKQWTNKRTLREDLFYLIFILPSVIPLALLILWPFINVFILSTQNQNLLKQAKEFVGLDNFIQVLTNQAFWDALRIDMLWTAGAVLFAAVLGLWSSLLLNQSIPLRNLARGLIIFPYVVPTVVAVLVWKYMFNDLYGVINQALIGISLKPSTWLSSPKSALFSIILVGTWKFFPFFVIALLARLQVISRELYEAAEIDGANLLQTFRYITLPSIMPVFLLTIMLRIIWTFNKFDIIYLLTGGGPGRATTTLPILIYNKIFTEYKIGVASAMAIIMFVFLGVFGLVYSYISEKTEDINE